MSIGITTVNSIEDLDKYVHGGSYKNSQHELTFFHRKNVPTLKTHKKDFGPALQEGITKGIEEMQSRLKPQYKNAPLWIGVFTGPNMPEDMIVRVGVRSILKGLATTEELLK